MPRVPWDTDDRKPPKGIFLWLDDYRPMPAHYTHWAKTAREAIALLETGEVVEISLDHDLANEHETGYDVAKWIEERAHAGTLKKMRCKVHSQNVVGKQNIKLALQSAYRAWGK